MSADAPSENGVHFDESQYDPEQIKLMEERLIVVDNDDNYVRDGSKKECHLMVNIRAPQSLLHRAFSCFIFRPEDGRLLLQRRADEKITFPSMWTNTCCSHPLAIKSEMDLENHIGVRRAVQRKLEHELGIPYEQVPLDELCYITRIHYLAESSGIWGEHEIDHIVFATLNVTMNLNLNEVSDVKWVNKEELEELFKDQTLTFTPWFKLIAKSFLYKWWDELLKNTDSKNNNVVADIAAVKKAVTDEDRNTIHRM